MAFDNSILYSPAVSITLLKARGKFSVTKKDGMLLTVYLEQNKTFVLTAVLGKRARQNPIHPTVVSLIMASRSRC